MAVSRSSRAKVFYLLFFFPLLICLISHRNVWEELLHISYYRHMIAVLIIIIVLWIAIKKKSLDITAIPLVLLFGYIVTIVSGVYSASLIAFLVAGSKVTKIGQQIKSQFEADFKENGQRNWLQVTSNSGIVMLLCLLLMVMLGHGERPVDFHNFLNPVHQIIPSLHNMISSYIHLGILGAIGCCVADTFASELGPIFAKHPPILITHPQRSVPIGTNGGITLCGLMCSALGGLLQGCVHFIFTLLLCYPRYSLGYLLQTQWLFLPLGMTAGVLGSLVDSLLGATVQYSGLIEGTNKITEIPGPNVKYICGRSILDNDLVNFASSAIIATILPLLASFLLF